MANFNGQTAVITGGAQGIGLATAKKFINDGCEVMIWDIDKKFIKGINPSTLSDYNRNHGIK